MTDSMEEQSNLSC